MVTVIVVITIVVSAIVIIIIISSILIKTNAPFHYRSLRHHKNQCSTSLRSLRKSLFTNHLSRSTSPPPQQFTAHCPCNDKRIIALQPSYPWIHVQ